MVPHRRQAIPWANKDPNSVTHTCITKSQCVKIGASLIYEFLWFCACETKIYPHCVWFGTGTVLEWHVNKFMRYRVKSRYVPEFFPSTHKYPLSFVNCGFTVWLPVCPIRVQDFVASCFCGLLSVICEFMWWFIHSLQGSMCTMGNPSEVTLKDMGKIYQTEPNQIANLCILRSYCATET